MHRNILFLLMLGIAGTVWADEFSEFRVPRNRAVQTGFRFGTNFSRQANGSSDTDWSKSTSYSHLGNCSFYNSLWTESDRATNELFFGGYLNESVSRRDANYRGHYIGENGNDHSQGYSFGSGAALDLSHSRYFVGDLVGAIVNLQGRAEYSGSGDEQHGYSRRWTGGGYPYVERSYRSDSEDWSQEYRFSIDGGPKFGRTRNVTAVASALVMEQRLIDTGILSGRLQPNIRASLAKIIYSYAYYGKMHDRSSKFFWTDVEKVVASDPAYVKPLDAYTLLHIQEGYLGSTTRFCGWSFSPRVSYAHTNELRHSWDRQVQVYWEESEYEYQAYERYDSRAWRTDFVSYGAVIAYDVPFGLNWQYHLDARYFHDPKTNSAGNPHTQNWRTGLGSTLTWFVTDRWLGKASMNIDLYYYDMVGDASWMREGNDSRFLLEVDYLVLDKVSVFGEFSDRIGYSLERTVQDNYYFGDSHTQYHENFTRWSEFRIGMTYSFSGPVLPNSNNNYYYSN